MREFLREAWAYALALVFYGLSLALVLFGGVMAWIAIKDVVAGEGVVENLVVTVVALLMVGVGVLVGLVAPRVIRKLSGTDVPPPPPTA